MIGKKMDNDTSPFVGVTTLDEKIDKLYDVIHTKVDSICHSLRVKPNLITKSEFKPTVISVYTRFLIGSENIYGWDKFAEVLFTQSQLDPDNYFSACVYTADWWVCVSVMRSAGIGNFVASTTVAENMKRLLLGAPPKFVPTQSNVLPPARPCEVLLDESRNKVLFLSDLEHGCSIAAQLHQFHTPTIPNAPQKSIWLFDRKDSAFVSETISRAGVEQSQILNLGGRDISFRSSDVSEYIFLSLTRVISDSVTAYCPLNDITKLVCLLGLYAGLDNKSAEEEGLSLRKMAEQVKHSRDFALDGCLNSIVGQRSSDLLSSDRIDSDACRRWSRAVSAYFKLHSRLANFCSEEEGIGRNELNERHVIISIGKGKDRVLPPLLCAAIMENRGLQRGALNTYSSPVPFIYDHSILGKDRDWSDLTGAATKFVFNGVKADEDAIFRSRDTHKTTIIATNRDDYKLLSNFSFESYQCMKVLRTKASDFSLVRL